MNPYIITADPSQKNITIMTKDEFDQKKIIFLLKTVKPCQKPKKKQLSFKKSAS